MAGPIAVTSPSPGLFRYGGASPRLGGAFKSGMHQVRFNANFKSAFPKTAPKTIVKTVPTAKPINVGVKPASAPKMTSSRSGLHATSVVGGSSTNPFSSDVESVFRPGEAPAITRTPKVIPPRLNLIKPAPGSKSAGTLVNGVYRPPSVVSTPNVVQPKTIVASPIPSVRVAPVMAPIAPAPAPAPAPVRTPVIPAPVPVPQPKPAPLPSVPKKSPALPDVPRIAPDPDPVIPIPEPKTDPDPEVVPDKVPDPKTVPFVPPYEKDDELVNRMEREIADIDKEPKRDRKGGTPIVPPIPPIGADIVPEPPDDDEDKDTPPLRITIDKEEANRIPDFGGGIDPCTRLAIQYGRFGIVALRGVDDEDPCLLQLLEALGVTSKEALRRSI